MDNTELFTCYNLQPRLLHIFKNFKFVAKIQEQQLLKKSKGDLKYKLQRVIKYLKNDFFLIHILKSEAEYLKSQSTKREIIVKTVQFTLSDISHIANILPIYKV